MEVNALNAFKDGNSFCSKINFPFTPDIFASLCTHLVLAIPTASKSLYLTPQDQQVNITFTLFVTDMSGCDSTSACDLYVNISCASKNSSWQACGQTSKRQDDNFPVWPEIFTYSYLPETSQRWKFEIIDVDVAFDDIIATIELNVDDYVDAPGNLYQVRVPENTGVFWIHRMR